MKKTVFLALFTLVAFTSIGTKAEINCDGGDLFTTTVDGKEKTFCMSKIRMNWWSALAWCRAHGLEMPTLYQTCGVDTSLKYEVPCPAFASANRQALWLFTEMEHITRHVLEHCVIEPGVVGGAGHNRIATMPATRADYAYALCQ